METVASRLLQVLGAFSAERPHLSLSEISRRTGLPLAIVHRFTGDLPVWGRSTATPAGTTASGCGSGRSPRSRRAGSA